MKYSGLAIVRHGETFNNAEFIKKLYNQKVNEEERINNAVSTLDDSKGEVDELTSKGHRDAENAATNVWNFATQFAFTQETEVENIRIIFAVSTFKRCQQTAKHITKRFKKQLPNSKLVDIKDLSKNTNDQNQLGEYHNIQIIDGLLTEFDKDKHTAEDVNNRASKVIRFLRAADDIARITNVPTLVVLVSHAGTINAIHNHLFGKRVGFEKGLTTSNPFFGYPNGGTCFFSYADTAIDQPLQVIQHGMPTRKSTIVFRPEKFIFGKPNNTDKLAIVIILLIAITAIFADQMLFN